MACLNETRRLDIKTNAAARGDQLYQGLLKLAKKHGIIGDVRGGHGLMNGLELVSNRATKTPIDMATLKHIHQRVYDAGGQAAHAHRC